MHAAGFSEMLVPIYLTVQRPAPEVIHRCENLTSVKFQKYVNSTLAPDMKEAKSTKPGKKFCIKNIVELLFGMVPDFDVKVADAKLRALEMHTCCKFRSD